MTIQHFTTGSSAVAFPWLYRDDIQGTVQAVQMRKMLWHAPAKRLVGVFTNSTTDYEYTGGITNFMYTRLAYFWRDGTTMDLVSVPVLGWGTTMRVTHNDLGETIRANMQGDVAQSEMSNVHSGLHFYPISERWAHDIIPETRGIVSMFTTQAEGTFFVGSTVAYAVNPLAAAGTFSIQKKLSNSIVYSATGTTWRHPRDLLYINSTRAAATFMQDSGGTVNASLAALIRLFATTTDPWTLLWTDVLPVTDSIATYDPEYEILYSAGKWASNATVHASKLKQSPASLSTITLRSGTTLQELQTTGISILVTDELGSGISGVLVYWTLSAQTQSGAFLSAYTKTNASGIATAVYVGPKLSANFTEKVSAVVATIDAVWR